MRRALPTAVLALLVAWSAPGLAADSIGSAISVDTEVTTGWEGAEVLLITGDKLYPDDRIATNLTGVAQIEFADKTRLAIGPGSTLTLDRFVYDPRRTKTDIVMGFGRGSFRFITGNGPHQGYSINTPTATIGVRGTAFDVYVDDEGDMTVAMINGEVEVCSTWNLVCRTHRTVGRFLHLTRDGVFTVIDRWDDAVMKGVGFAVGMPFMVNDRVLKPTFRAGTTVVRRYASATGQAVGKAASATGEAVGKAATATGEAAGTVVKAPVRAVQGVPKVLQNINPFKKRD